LLADVAGTAAKCSVFIATSLDGFISRKDGSIDWLDQANARVPAGEDCGYAQFMSTVDALVMGRHTFELASSFAQWPYGQTPVFVLSGSMSSLPAGVPGTVRLSRETPAALVARLSAQGMKHLYIDGGVTIQRFVADGLIDEVTITRIPVLIGAGRPLFGPLSSDVRLEHLSTRAFDFGFVQSKYRVVKAPRPWVPTVTNGASRRA
jgi:dihydrofolate reductase